MVADERYFMIYCIVYRYLCTNKIETITLTIMNKSSKLSIIPVMLCFFAMGFVDLVGIASNYVRKISTSMMQQPICSHRWYSSGFSSSRFLRES